VISRRFFLPTRGRSPWPRQAFFRRNRAAGRGEAWIPDFEAGRRSQGAQLPFAWVATLSTPCPPSYPTANRLLTTAVGERPQERIARLGAGALSDAELLALVLRSGTRGQDVLTLAHRLLAEAGSVARLAAWRREDFQQLKGIGRVKALQLLAVMEMARRVMGPEVAEEPLLAQPERVHAFLQPRASGLQVEKFWVLCLNRKNRLLKCCEITSGTATAALAHPREVFRAAVRESAAAIICAHNHPSGDPAPSTADLQVTRQLREAARAVDIPLLDHVIVGRAQADPAGRGYFSFREAGMV